MITTNYCFGGKVTRPPHPGFYKYDMCYESTTSGVNETGVETGVESSTGWCPTWSRHLGWDLLV